MGDSLYSNWNDYREKQLSDTRFRLCDVVDISACYTSDNIENGMQSQNLLLWWPYIWPNLEMFVLGNSKAQDSMSKNRISVYHRHLTWWLAQNRASKNILTKWRSSFLDKILWLTTYIKICTSFLYSTW